MATRKRTSGTKRAAKSAKRTGRKSTRNARKTSRNRTGAKKSSAKTVAQKKVKKAMHERKSGTLHSGRSGKKVTSRKQAIAIGLSEARKSGAKVPEKKS